MYCISEQVVWLIFSVLTGFGYVFSVFTYAQKHIKLSVFHIVLPIILWIFIVGVGMLLTKLLCSKNQCFYFSQKERAFLEGIVLVLLGTAGYIFRFAAPFCGIWQNGLEEDFFHYAQVVQEQVPYISPHLISRIYVRFLHLICLLFGNIYQIGANVQFVLLIVGVFIWYLALKKLFGMAAALFFAAGAMLLPDSIISSLQCDPSMLLFCIYGCTALAGAGYVRSDSSSNTRWCCFTEFFLGIFTACCVFADISGILFLFGLGTALAYTCKRYQRGFIKHFCFSACGFIIGAVFLVGLPVLFYGVGLQEALQMQSYNGLFFTLPTSEGIHAYLWKLGEHRIFILSAVVTTAYWFLRHRRAITYMMAEILFLLGIQFFGLDTYMKHDFLIYMSLLALTGMTLKQYFKKYEVKEPDVTVVHFEEQHIVEVPKIK